MAWVAVNPDGKFKIFEFYPHRFGKAITKPADYLEGDNHPDIPTGDFRYFWAYAYDSSHSLYLSYNEGIDINKESLSKELQLLTWKNDPVKI